MKKLVSNLSRLKPSTQRELVLGLLVDVPRPVSAEEPGTAVPVEHPTALQTDSVDSRDSSGLLDLARATATDGRQRAVGAQDPEELEALRDQALVKIGSLEPADVTRFVLPWLWDAARTGGRALTDEGQEFGFELRFSRYKDLQVKV